MRGPGAGYDHSDAGSTNPHDTSKRGHDCMRQSTRQDVLIEQNGARITVDATFTPDTETGDPEGWTI